MAAATDTVSADELQQSIRDLVSERNLLRDRIRRPGMAAAQGPSANLRRAGEGDAAGVGMGRRAFSSDERRKRERPASTAAISESFAIEKRPKVESDEKLTRRNRNLFGSLLGHLKRAKSTLENEKETKQQEAMKAQQELVEEKLELQKRNLAELRRRDFQEQKRQNIARWREVQKQIHTKDNELLRLNLENHYRRMTNFIRTSAEPTIFWLPAVHTDRTRHLQEETKAQIENKVKMLAIQLPIEPEDQAEQMGGTGSPQSALADGEGGVKDEGETAAAAEEGVEEEKEVKEGDQQQEEEEPRKEFEEESEAAAAGPRVADNVDAIATAVEKDGESSSTDDVVASS